MAWEMTRPGGGRAWFPHVRLASPTPLTTLHRLVVLRLEVATGGAWPGRVNCDAALCGVVGGEDCGDGREVLSLQLHGGLTSVQPSRAVLRPRPLPCPASLASCVSTAFVHEPKPSPLSSLLPQFLEALKTVFGITTDSRNALLESRGRRDLAGLQDALAHTLSLFSSSLSSFLHPCILDPFYSFIHFYLASSMYEYRALGEHGSD